MATTEYILQYIAFRILNIPFYITGYSKVITVLSIMTSIWTSGWYAENSVVNPVTTARREYDFIVVGGGSAGATVANRLSESGEYQVLLLEAGGDPTPYNSIPALAPFNLHLTTDWHYRIEPQNNSCFESDEQRMMWPRGRMLGGSSMLNFMVYQRGNPRCFENWAKKSGDKSWEYDNLLPYFKKLEDYHGNWPNPKFHGTGGPVKIQYKTYQPGIDYWVAAGAEMGFDTTTDPNSYQVPSFQKMDTFIYRGKRQGTFQAYLLPYLSRPNLHISRNSHVVKVNFDNNLRATGVTYVREGVYLEAFARNEIVISAGAIGTPHLLMLSGIGPAEHLLDFGIQPLVNSPGVGENLQDHVLVQLGPFLLDAPISFLLERDLDFNSVVQWETNGTGPISSNIVSGTAFFSTPGAAPAWPNIQLHLADLGVRHGASEDFTVCYGFNPKALMEYYAPYSKKDANFVLINLGRPKSTGIIELKTKDPFIHPRIDPRYFSHPDDMKSMVDAMQFVLKIYETKAFKSVGGKYASKPLPQCQHLPFKSDAYFECYMRTLTSTIYHPCCTAKFGSNSDPMAVLDSKLRVKGVRGLRVADASVMPQIVNANLNAPTIMIGEKAADMILSTWGFIKKRK